MMTFFPFFTLLFFRVVVSHPTLYIYVNNITRLTNYYLSTTNATKLYYSFDIVSIIEKDYYDGRLEMVDFQIRPVFVFRDKIRSFYITNPKKKEMYLPSVLHNGVKITFISRDPGEFLSVPFYFYHTLRLKPLTKIANIYSEIEMRKDVRDDKGQVLPFTKKKRIPFFVEILTNEKDYFLLLRNQSLLL